MVVIVAADAVVIVDLIVVIVVVVVIVAVDAVALVVVVVIAVAVDVNADIVAVVVGCRGRFFPSCSQAISVAARRQFCEAYGHDDEPSEWRPRMAMALAFAVRHHRRRHPSYGGESSRCCFSRRVPVLLHISNPFLHYGATAHMHLYVDGLPSGPHACLLLRLGGLHRYHKVTL